MNNPEILDTIMVKVSEDTGLSKDIVEKTYRAFWRAIREHISSLPLKQDLTDEEFKRLQPNVNIPSIGKLHVTLERYHRMKKVHEKFLKLKDTEDAAHQKD